MANTDAVAESDSDSLAACGAQSTCYSLVMIGNEPRSLPDVALQVYGAASPAADPMNMTFERAWRACRALAVALLSAPSPHSASSGGASSVAVALRRRSAIRSMRSLVVLRGRPSAVSVLRWRSRSA